MVLAATTYKSFDLDRYFVPKELVLHLCAAAAALLCLRGCKRLTLSAVDVLIAGFLVASVVSASFATNRWVAERALAISCSGAALFWVASALRRDGLVRPLLVALAFAVVVGAATSLAQAYGVQTEFFSLNRAPGGTFGNRNFVAHLCAIGAPVVVLVALTARRGFGSLFGGLGMVVVAAALVLSRSRAAWLAVLVLAVPVAVLALMTWSRWCEPRTLRRLIVLGGATAIGVVAAVVVPNHLEWKSDSPFLDSATGLVNYKEGSGHGRLVQYGNTLRMTAARPVLGVGPGNWAVVYPKYATHNDPSMSQEGGLTSNPWPSSDWVAYLSERGVVGFALLLSAMIGLVWRALRDSARRHGSRSGARAHRDRARGDARRHRRRRCVRRRASRRRADFLRVGAGRRARPRGGRPMDSRNRRAQTRPRARVRARRRRGGTERAAARVDGCLHACVARCRLGSRGVARSRQLPDSNARRSSSSHSRRLCTARVRVRTRRTHSFPVRRSRAAKSRIAAGAERGWPIRLLGTRTSALRTSANAAHAAAARRAWSGR